MFWIFLSIPDTLVCPMLISDYNVPDVPNLAVHKMAPSIALAEITTRREIDFYQRRMKVCYYIHLQYVNYVLHLLL